jgi:formylglycine-generating enzyme required for sulfatase activity
MQRTHRTETKESEMEAKSIGERETQGQGREAGNGAVSFGERETWRGEGNGLDVAREWVGKRWKEGEEILGRYVVEGELGQGGMGVVYACRDKVGGIRVAVKALPPELSHNSVEMEEVRENFELVYKLSHPNIAGARTLEQDGQGAYFLVMEVAEGESLRTWMRRKQKEGGVSLEAAAGVLRQVAAALDYAHGERVVHRDVKPGNVMVDGRGRAKVLDFGLAAQIRTSLSRVSRAFRGTSGTGPYMAPEQWEAQPQDAKTDQYALAVMAYEMLAGRLPFENSDPDVLKEAVLHGEIREIPGLAKGAMGVLRRGMAKDPAKRFGSCGEFVEALAGGATEKSGSRFAGSGKSQRKGSRWGLLAALVVVAVAGVGAWWWSGRGAKDAGGTHSLPQEEMRQDMVQTEEARVEEEEARLAEQRAVEEAERLAAEERERAEREAREAFEEEEAYKLSAAAHVMSEKAAGRGCDRGQGFGEKLDEMQEKLRQGDAAVLGRSFGKAKAWFEESMAAAGWVETNAPLRAAATAKISAAKKAKQAADGKDAVHLAPVSYGEGNRHAKAGVEAFKQARFGDASRELGMAADAYARAGKEAFAARVEKMLETARAAAARGDWESCGTAAKRVLALDAGNGEAKRLKEEAEENAVPSILLHATLDGREVAARVTEGLQAGRTTPVAAELEEGGDYSFALVYESEGKTYAGRVTVEAKERGRTEATAVLVERAAGETKTITLPGGATMEMAWCPPGSFLMGSPRDEKGREKGAEGLETQHRVTLTKGFWIAKTEVTVKQWTSVMGGEASSKMNALPVVNVLWDDCVEFCRKAGNGLQLPTEAQWEYACRAGSTGPYGGTGKIDDMGWHLAFRLGPAEHTHPVAQKKPNDWGLYDMHGNVWEWCADWFQKDLGTVDATDPTGPASGEKRVCRGGSWYEFAKTCRSATRAYVQNPFGMQDRGVVLGFRPVSLVP